jgi:DNA-binding GntR family transcriptional regulator
MLRDHSRLTNFFESSSVKGINARACILDIQVISAKHKVAKALSIQEGDPVIRIKTLRYADEIPVTVHDAHIPHALFPQFLNEDLRTLEAQHLWSFFESYGYGKSAVQSSKRAKQTRPTG